MLVGLHDITYVMSKTIICFYIIWSPYELATSMPSIFLGNNDNDDDKMIIPFSPGCLGHILVEPGTSCNKRFFSTVHFNIRCTFSQSEKAA